MAFERPITIKEALNHIHRREYVLPAIQRELVWGPRRIERLFDSLMRGYPIGSFLFWKVRGNNVKNYRFYDFVLNYHEKERPHNDPLILDHSSSDLTAVLDGQQRLTALNIGLRGSHASKLPRLWWNNPLAFPTKKLYLNLLRRPGEDEDGIWYEFRFLTAREAERRDDSHLWHKTSDILRIDDSADLIDVVHDIGLTDTREPHKLLNRLHKVVHDEGIVSRYEETSQDLHKVLNIFVRTNSGGTPLSYSDMLLSIATAQWNRLDARGEIHGIVDEINRIGQGFSFNKDWVLKAALMLSDIGDIGFKVTNFNATNVNIIQDRWDSIKVSIRSTVELAAGFGYSSANLSATNSLLPIAYYIHQDRVSHNLLERDSHRRHRNLIRRWLVRSLLKRGVWGSGLDTLLLSLRRSIIEHVSEEFPIDNIEAAMRQRGKGLEFSEEELEDLVDTRYGDRRTFGILTLLYPFVDVRRNQFHIDHVFPKSLLTKTKLRRASVDQDEIDSYVAAANGLANLQLLSGVPNLEKASKLPRIWLKTQFDDADMGNEYAERHDLGDLPAELIDFNGWYEARRNRMLIKLRKILGVAAPRDDAEYSDEIVD